jgi:hypothetical protein
MIDVEPLIASELQRMLPLPDGGSADWGDVLRRSGFESARRQWRPMLLAAVAVAALVGVGVAIAAGFGAFNGISAAQHPQTSADRLDPKDLPPDCNSGSPGADSPFCHLILGSARLVATVPNGGKLWVVTDTHGDLCVILQDGGGSCTSALTPSQPTTVESFKANDQTPAISWGITLDNVTAVSFPAGGQVVTVPVKNNVWFYVGDNSGLVSMTIHFNDGSTERPQSDVPASSGG